MPRKKKVNLDQELAKLPQPFDYPKVKNAPASYPHLLGIKGRTWYERAINYEKMYGKKVEPLIKEDDGTISE